MAQRFPTESPTLYRKFKGADKQQIKAYNTPNPYITPEQAKEQFRKADVQMKGIRQRVFSSPRIKAIQEAEKRFDAYTFTKPDNPKMKSKYVSQNWKKFL